MKIIVTGATGFTGSYVVPRLLEQDFEVHCLARASSDRSVIPGEQVTWITGDLGDEDALAHAFEGMDALVNIASLGFGHAPGIVRAALDHHIQRGIFLSSTAIFTRVNAPSKAARTAGEMAVSDSPLDYTILRPTMIYGSARDRNMSRLIGFLRRYPLFPMFGSGEHLQQPVYVDDVAAAVVACLQEPNTIRQAYNIAGKAALTYNQVIDTIAHTLNRSIFKLHVPAAPVVTTLRLTERLKLRLPIKAEQILRLEEDKQFDYGGAARDFGYQPRDFAEGIRLELRAMGLL
ncbi:MAG TPA: NAD-dependent epimerase/dehydratase family protein [Phototrophicaceae bacterium]|nr:NAD-dependent epimerase/dehydratase family protein [Phototrophicaceae bacterium]